MARTAKKIEAANITKSGHRPTMKDVAMLAGVSIGTVSRVVNENAAVKPKSRLRVIEAMAALGFAPNVVAQSMRTRLTKTIGCIVPSIATSFFARAILAAETDLYERGFTMMVVNTLGVPKREAEAVRTLQGRRVDGLIGIFSESDEMLRSQIGAVNVPMVVIDRHLPELASSVVNDYFSGTSQAIEALIAMGHRRIALFIESSAIYFGSECERAYISVHRAHGIKIDERMVVSVDLSQEEAYRRTASLINSPVAPTAIIAGAYLMPGVLRALASLSRRIPEDVSVISLGESDVTELYQPSLTSVRLHSEEAGHSAARLLLEKLTSSFGRAEIVLPVELVMRKSCASAPR